MPLKLFEELVKDGDVVGRFAPEVAYQTGPKRVEPRRRALVLGKVDADTNTHTPSNIRDVVLTELEFPYLGIPDMVRRVKGRGSLYSPRTLIEYAYAVPSATVVAFQDNIFPDMYEVFFFSEQPPQLNSGPELKLLTSGAEPKQLYSGNHLKLLK